MTSPDADDTSLPRALAQLGATPRPARRTGGLSVDRIVEAAIELADADGLTALSMARLAKLLDCGTMSLYRHVASKDQLVVFMLSAASGTYRSPGEGTDWRAALTLWADGLWQVYHRHPWILQAASVGPPTDPGQLSWLDAGLAALRPTRLVERDKLGAVMAVLHFVRGAAALSTGAGVVPQTSYRELLAGLVDGHRFPALAAAVDAGAFDGSEGDALTEFHTGLEQLLDGIAVRVAAT